MSFTLTATSTADGVLISWPDQQTRHPELMGHGCYYIQGGGFGPGEFLAPGILAVLDKGAAPGVVSHYKLDFCDPSGNARDTSSVTFPPPLSTGP